MTPTWSGAGRDVPSGAALLLLRALQRRRVRQPGRQLHRPPVGAEHLDDRRVVVEHRGDVAGAGEAAQHLALHPAGRAVVVVARACAAGRSAGRGGPASARGQPAVPLRAPGEVDDVVLGLRRAQPGARPPRAAGRGRRPGRTPPSAGAGPAGGAGGGGRRPGRRRCRTRRAAARPLPVRARHSPEPDRVDDVGGQRQQAHRAPRPGSRSRSAAAGACSPPAASSTCPAAPGRCRGPARRG